MVYDSAIIYKCKEFKASEKNERKINPQRNQFNSSPIDGDTTIGEFMGKPCTV